MEDKLPAHARLFDQAKYIDQIEKQMTDCRVTDVRKDLLSHKDDYIYYKTDHHRTSEGAYLAYETWCDSTGMESTPLADLKKQVATQKFRGSLYSKMRMRIRHMTVSGRMEIRSRRHTEVTAV